MRLVPAVTGNDPKYLRDVWIVEELFPAAWGMSVVLGVFDTLEGAQKFNHQISSSANGPISISKTAYYTTNWSDLNEEY